MKRVGKVVRERIGVECSLNRRILALCESVGLVLVDVRDLDHLSRQTLVFDDREKCLYEVKIECKLKESSKKKPSKKDDPAEPFKRGLRQGSLTHPAHPLSCTCGCQEGAGS